MPSAAKKAFFRSEADRAFVRNVPLGVWRSSRDFPHRECSNENCFRPVSTIRPPVFIGVFIGRGVRSLALSRTVGWISQWKEMRLNGEPIGRPRQVYNGETDRPFVELDKR